MKRVLHVTTAHPVRDNRIFRKECAALVDAGCAVSLLAVHDKDETLEGIRVLSLPRRNSRLARMLLGPVDALRRIGEARPNIIHGHDPELIPLLVLYRIARPDIRVIYDAHEDLPEQVMGKRYLHPRLRPVIASAARLLELAAAKVLDAVVAATPHIQSSFDDRNSYLVQNYPWLRDYPDPLPYPEGSGAVLCYVGRISQTRGLHAMKKLAARTDKHTRMVLAGIVDSGSEEVITGSHFTYLGEVPAQAVPAVIAESNVGLSLFEPLPNHLESQPTKIYEYMASARPFVASNFPHWVHLFEHHDCGILVDPTDPQAVEEAVDKLASDPALAAEMGRRGRRAVEQEFSFESQARELLRLYTSLDV